MKILIFSLSLLTLFFWGCSGRGGSAAADGSGAEDSSVVAAEKKTVRPAMNRRHSRIPFEKSLSHGPVHFNLSSPNVPEENTLVVAPTGFENRNDTFQVEVVGRVFDAQLADLNKDGFPEVYAFSRSAGSDSTSFAYGFASYRNLSYGPVNVRELAVKPELEEGFNGHDRFYFEGGVLKRAFPIHEEGRPTSKKRIVAYTLYQGETSFILEPSSGEVVEGD